MIKNQYRTDIDGLRAIAVVAVILHHFSAEWLPGGYVGVDVFFVISGFLITDQLYRAIRASEFKFSDFYKKRIGRIFPALYFVVFLSVIFGAIFVSPRDYLNLLNSSLYALVGVSNIFFWREYGNYFAAETAEAPLLHTWSLGVEEQFYVFWPVVLLLFVPRLKERWVIFGVFLLCLLGGWFSEYFSNRYASAAYYLIPSRFFEFLIGALLVFPMLRGRLAMVGGLSANVFSTVGILLILGSLVYFDSKSVFPGMAAAIPCFGVALLIAFCGRSWLFGILSSKAFVTIGLLSYSLYLWHWPFIAFANYFGVSINFGVALVLALGMFFLSYISWRYVEVPLRSYSRGVPFRTVFYRLFFIPLLAVVLLVLVGNLTAGFPQRFDEKVSIFEAQLSQEPNILRQGCHVPTALYKTQPNEMCVLGVNKKNFDGILIGDSFANHFSGTIDILARHDKKKILDYTMDGCPPIFDYYDNKKRDVYAISCVERNNIIKAHLSQANYSTVILSANWFGRSDAENELRGTIDWIQRRGMDVILIAPNPIMLGAASCEIKNITLGLGSECSVVQPDLPDFIRGIVYDYPNLRLIEPAKYLCSMGRCASVVDGVLLFRDNVHLNNAGAVLLGNKMIESGWKF
ncbi:acyltransferase family protein [Kerstersia gyiorum]|uniref:acyltransferase family protein n=1 Tax=Kerstersia gyiorum TaxID=206506 RepID=UPI0039E91533